MCNKVNAHQLIFKISFTHEYLFTFMMIIWMLKQPELLTLPLSLLYYMAKD